jgi:SAM-dependent methyltransferase
VKLAGLPVAPRRLAWRGFRCPACGPSLLLRLGEDETQVRCLRCRGTPVHLALVDALAVHVGDLARLDAYELSSGGALLRHLRRRCRSVAASELLDGVPRGEVRDGVRCEDVQRLSFDDASFDLCTSTEVFEHVPDDIAGFRELHRVLRPGGRLVLTVPLGGAERTVERARVVDGKVEHLLPPAYHGDRLTGAASVLVYRDYGRDILERLRACGFADAFLHRPARGWFGHARQVVVALRGA